MAGGLRRLFRRENSTEEEIKQLIDENENELAVSTKELLNNIFEFSETTAGDIMTHRTDIVAVSDEDTLLDVAEAAMEEGCSRIPVFHEDLDNILGIIYAKDLLKFVGKEIGKDENLKDYIRTPLFVPETIPCGKLFAKMTETRIQLAIVVDEYGGTAGLVTLEDVVEELVGDIEDEYDEEEESVVRLNENTWLFRGITDIEDAEEAMETKFPEGDYDTLAGFVISRLGFVPSGKEDNAVVDYNGFTFTVLKVEERRIEEIKAERIV